MSQSLPNHLFPRFLTEEVIFTNAFLKGSISSFVRLHWNLDTFIFMNVDKELLCLEISVFLVERSPRTKPRPCDM